MSSVPNDASLSERKPRKSPKLTDGEFTALIAFMLGLNAFGIDAILPALPEIGESLDVRRENDLQWLVSVYLFGFGAAQLVFGPVADRVGRRPVLLWGFAAYGVLSLVGSFLSDFHLLLAVRALQGCASAAVRVLAVSIVRDRFEGATMARIMSLAMTIFLTVPVLAPGVGQILMMAGGWRSIFVAFAAYSLLLAIWVSRRLPETLAKEARRDGSLSSVLDAMRKVVTDRASLSFTLSGALSLGMLMAYIIASPQIINDYGVGALFPVYFGLGAAGLVVASVVNSRIVMRRGCLSVIVAALLALVVVNSLNLIWMSRFDYSLAVFVGFQMAILFFVGLTTPNYMALAMEHMGEIAGSASSVQGAVTSLGSAAIGTMIGQSYNGSPATLMIGYAICTAVQLIIVWRSCRRTG